nr:MAG TPA: hypothetical protein [Caudoviricetes sp.]
MMSDSTCTAPLPLRLEASDDRPCHDRAAQEIVRQARKRALAYQTEAHDSHNRAARGLTYYPSTRKTKTKKETDR